MQKELFEESNSNEKNDKNKQAVIKVNTTKQKPLTKVQQQFNRLTTRISNLRNEITAISEKLQTLHHFHEAKVWPEIVTLGEEKIRYAHLLHKRRNEAKLSKPLKEKLDAIILDMLTDAFYVTTPTEEDKKLFSLYGEVDFDEEEARQKSEALEMMSDMIFEQTGMRIDPEELTKENPDFDKLKEQYEQQLNENAKKASSKRKKSQRTLDKEKREEQKEALKRKSLRSIYLSLAKILHPDTEVDEALKAQKEEYMKRVAVAYENKNLPELLELEIQWVNKHENQLENTPEEVLKIYTELLKEQVDNLKQELLMIKHNPMYQNISPLLIYDIVQAMEVLKADKETYSNAHKEYADKSNDLENTANPRRAITDSIEHLYEEEDDDMGDMFEEIMMQMMRTGKFSK